MPDKESGPDGRRRTGRGVRRLARLALDLGISPLAYYGLFLAGVPTWRALLAATVVAGGWLLVTVALDRRVDGLAAFMLGMYAVMFGLAVATADERLLLVRDPLTSGLAGAVFLATCATATPATAYLARRVHRATVDADGMRRHRVQTAVLGTGLVAEAAARMVLVFTLPVRVAAGVSPVVEFAVLPVLVGWMLAYRRRTALGGAR
ncbi:VC0807 family protein [Actinocatenispora rupis]|uniref:Intracellular septation protein A n=1 Tax=Actinocatenispora rupis TaxID=519421 RepID=A0A8J3NBL1_9ACTN|nr:VC0807 family protein [Actinocatenispora rupis]GID10777.1 hypothetical protein Aru02nite_16660 [Actinocatenispora rupis]